MDELNDKFKNSAENFSLIPSSKVWMNVEADIRKRERKKRFIIFFFIGAAILTGGIIFFANHSTTIHPQTEATEKKSTPHIIQTEKNNLTQENTVVQKTISENKYQKTNNKVAAQNASKKSIRTNSVSHAPNNKVLASEAKLNSVQKNLIADKSAHTEITESSATTGSQVETGIVKPDSSFANKINDMHSENNKDSLLAINSDSIKIKKDTLTASKDTIKTEKHQSKWSIAIGVAPTLSYSKSDGQSDYQIISDYRNSSDKNLLTWNYHFAVNYKIIPRLEIFTGIGIQNFEQQLLSNQAVYHYDTSILAGPVPIVTLTRSYYHINGDSTGTVRNKFSYLEIPIGVRYNFLSAGNFGIGIQPEVSFNKLIHSEGYIYNFHNHIYEKISSADLKQSLVSYGIGLSFQYAIRKNIQVEFTPYYKSFQKSIYASAYPVSEYVQQTEFRLSLSYLFK